MGSSLHRGRRCLPLRTLRRAPAGSSGVVGPFCTRWITPVSARMRRYWSRPDDRPTTRRRRTHCPAIEAGPGDEVCGSPLLLLVAVTGVTLSAEVQHAAAGTVGDQIAAFAASQAGVPYCDGGGGINGPTNGGACRARVRTGRQGLRLHEPGAVRRVPGHGHRVAGQREPARGSRDGHPAERDHHPGRGPPAPGRRHLLGRQPRWLLPFRYLRRERGWCGTPSASINRCRSTR